MFKAKDLAQLSMIQLMTLHTISKHSKPIVRHSLLIELNEILDSRARKIISSEQAFSDSLQKTSKKQISPSSFYTCLDALEKKRLVSFNRNKKGKVETVEKTQLTDLFLNFVHQYFLMNMINGKMFNKILFIKLKEIIETRKINKNNLFSLFPLERPDLEFIDYILQNYKNVFILGDEKIRDELNSHGKAKLNFSKVRNGQIREPDNDFDISIMQGFNQNYDFNKLSFEILLRELKRITRPDGVIYVFALKELNLSEPSIIENIISLYNNFMKKEGKLLSKSQLNETLLKIGLKNIDILEDEAMLYGIGEVP